MTAKLVDDITDTHSNKTRESIGQGIANIVTGFFGGMGGCAMIGQTMINVKISAPAPGCRRSWPGSFLLVLCIVFGAGRLRHPDGRPGRRHGPGLVRHLRLALHRARHPQADAGRRDRRHGRSPSPSWSPPTTSPSASSSAPSPPWSSSPGASPTWPTSPRSPTPTAPASSTPSPASCSSPPANDLVAQFDYAGDPDKVVIDLTAAHIWDASSVAALDAIETKYAAARQDRRDHRPERAQRRHPRHAQRRTHQRH